MRMHLYVLSYKGGARHTPNAKLWPETAYP